MAFQQSVTFAIERHSLAALSQRKLNALAIPIAYVDRQQRYRFANKAFLDWIDKRSDDVIGREVIEVLGHDIYQLYHAYIEAALDGERTGFERQLSDRAPVDLDPGGLLPGPDAPGPCAASSSPTATSTTSSAWSSRPGSASSAFGW